MAVLVDKSILKLVSDGKLGIIPFDENAVTSNGYDLLLEKFELAPKEFKLLKTVEKIKIPNDMVAIPILRTTFAFKGLVLSPGIIDAGYEGHLKFAVFNSSKEKIWNGEKGMPEKVVTLVFLNTSDKADLPFGQRDGEKNNSQ